MSADELLRAVVGKRNYILYFKGKIVRTYENDYALLSRNIKLVDIREVKDDYFRNQRKNN